MAVKKNKALVDGSPSGGPSANPAIEDDVVESPRGRYGWRLKDHLPGESNAAIEHKNSKDESVTTTIDMTDGFFVIVDGMDFGIEPEKTLKKNGFYQDWEFSYEVPLNGPVKVKTIVQVVEKNPMYKLAHPDNTPSHIIEVKGYEVFKAPVDEGSEQLLIGTVDIVAGMVHTDNKDILMTLLNEKGFILMGVEGR